MQAEMMVSQLAEDLRAEADKAARDSQDQHHQEQADISASHQLAIMTVEADTLARQHRAGGDHAARLEQIHRQLHEQLLALHRDALEA